MWSAKQTGNWQLWFGKRVRRTQALPGSAVPDGTALPHHRRPFSSGRWERLETGSGKKEAPRNKCVSPYTILFATNVFRLLDSLRLWPLKRVTGGFMHHGPRSPRTPQCALSSITCVPRASSGTARRVHPNLPMLVNRSSFHHLVNNNF